jgi:hypothetical protein
MQYYINDWVLCDYKTYQFGTFPETIGINKVFRDE